MLRLSPPLTLKLAAGELLACPRGGVTLRMVTGCAWVTQRNDPDDHFLQPGQAFELRAGGGTLISAEQELWLRFEAEFNWITRLWQRLSRLPHQGAAATVAG